MKEQYKTRYMFGVNDLLSYNPYTIFLSFCPVLAKQTLSVIMFGLLIGVKQKGLGIYKPFGF